MNEFNPETVDVWRGWDMEPYAEFGEVSSGYVSLDDYTELLNKYNELKWMYEGLCK